MVIGLVATSFLFNVEPTPVICVGFPSEDLMSNAVAGSVALLLAGTATAVVMFTTGVVWLLPTDNVWVFTLLKLTSSAVAKLNLPSF